MTENFESLNDVFLQRAKQEPNGLAYTLVESDDSERALTRQQLLEQAMTVAAALQQRGEKAARALLVFAPGLDFVIAYYGCLLAGTVAVPAYPPDPARFQKTFPRLQAIVNDADAHVVLSTDAITGLLKGMFPDDHHAEWIATDTLSPTLASGWRNPQATPDTLAFLQYTSGSTSNPRGVEVSHGNLLHNLQQIVRQAGYTRDTRVVSWLPAYHDMGLIGGILSSLYAGGDSTLMSPLHFMRRPLSWLQTISRKRASTTAAPNFAYDLCVRKLTPQLAQGLDLTCWKVAMNGAEPIRAATIERFVRAFKPYGFDRTMFFPAYGLAEATLLVTGTPVGRGPRYLRVKSRELRQHDLAIIGDGCVEPERVHMVLDDVRRSARVSVQLHVKVEEGEVSIKAYTLDISRHGMRIRGSAGLASFVAPSLRLRTMDGVDLRITANVAWKKPLEVGFEVGLKFVDRSDELTQQLGDLVARLAAAALEQGQVEQLLVGSGRAPNGKLAIVDPVTLQPLPEQKIGEIWVSSASVARGYWNKPSETAHTFGGEVAGERYLRTGDLGFIHDAELYVTGRVSDLIVIDGRNIYPQDVEAPVERCHPAIRSGCVAAFSIDTNEGEHLVVVAEVDQRRVDRRQGDDAGSSDERRKQERRQEHLPDLANVEGEEALQVDDVVASIRAVVADQCGLVVALLRPGALPKTSSGKLQRRACRAALLGKSLDVLAVSSLRSSL